MQRNLISSLSKGLTAALVVLILTIPAVSNAQQSKEQQNQNLKNVIKNLKVAKQKQVCDKDNTNSQIVSCYAQVITEDTNPDAAKTSAQPAGFGPKQLRQVYGTSGIAAGKTPSVIAIVAAYDDPNILSDLGVYSKQFGIPTLPSCSKDIAKSSVPCFQKVNQNGKAGSYPAKNASWDLEISLDVEAAHAMCQNCSLLLVEANSSSYNDLMTSIDKAATLGAKVISNSWGSVEFAGEAAFDSHLNKPGVAITFSSGDAGYGVQYPAASPYVTAVGGTTLVINPDGTYGGEAAWSGAGSGCSAYEAKPVFQTDTGCANRSVADVSAVADPSTGAAVYDSVKYGTTSGWFQVGGTSLSSPIIAAMYALSGNTAGRANSLPYLLANGDNFNLHDISVGSNGTCSISYFCNAGQGYDGPTGLGTPFGFSAF